MSAIRPGDRVKVAPQVHTTRLDEARKHMIEYLVADANDNCEAKDVGWYIREYFSNLSDVDLAQEFEDAGGAA